MEILKVENVTKKFGGFVAVNNVSFTVNRGETVAIIGPNGAGKTTLVNVITKKLEPDEGRVFFDGFEITRLPPHKITKLGLVRTFQVVNLFPTLTVRENMALAGLSAGATGEVRRVIEMLGLEEYTDRVVAKVPLGVQKLVELGTSLLLKPKMLILDEPVAGLGAEDRLNMVKVLSELKKSLNLIIIEHDMDVVFALVDRIIVMDKGRIIADGRPEDIRENKLVKEIYLGGE
ncbi:MAG: ABC transporter ATP-binding protein [Thermoprotei archaeon]|nr:ABC transporter ATP-binding protein [Thermoprotei archaeon]